MRRFLEVVTNPWLRLYFALALFGLSVVGWPLSAFWLARSEPPFILGLSWAAMIVSALTLIFTADVRIQQEEDE